MAQANPFDQFDSQAQPVPMQSLQPIIGAVPPEEQARKAREDELKLAAEERARVKFEQEQSDRAVRGGVDTTEAEKTAAFLATRVANGLKNLTGIEGGQSPEILGSMVGAVSETAGNYLTSEPRQRVEAAQRDVLDAALTLGTGAAYTAEQLEGYRRSYFPQLGDTQATIDDKQQRLRVLLEAAKVKAGAAAPAIDGALKAAYGDAPPSAAAPETRAAAEGEAFLTDQDKELQTKLSEAFAAGATRDELNAIAAPYGQTINNVTQEELDRVRAAGGGINVVPTGRDVADPREGMGMIEGALETVTGSARSTPEIEALPDWGDMPELNSLSVDSFQAALGTMMTNPQESVAILRAQFPGVQVRQDANGNFILRSADNGQEYAIKPGFRMSDVPRALGAIGAFTPAGRATTLAGAATAGGLTQAGIEASQAATGGEFNTEEVLLAAGGNVAGQQLGRGINAVRDFRAARAASNAPVAPTPLAPTVAAQAGGQVDTALTPEVQTEIGTIAREAISSGKRAKDAQAKLAIMAQVDPEAKAAAESLGIELPVDVLSNDARLLTVTGLARSQIGSDAQTAWGQAVSQAIQQSDDTLRAIGASRDLGQVSETIRGRLTSEVDNLKSQADLIREEVDSQIKKTDRIVPEKLRAVFAEMLPGFGTIDEAREVLSSEEKRLLAALGENLDKTPTYGYLNRLREDLGEAMRGKGPWKDVNEAARDKYYGALAEDRVAYVESVGGKELANKMRASNDLYHQMFKSRKTMQTVYGKALEKDIGPLIKSAVTSGSKGDGQALRKLMAAVPEDLRPQAVLSGIFSLAERQSAQRGFSFAEYAKLYSGLRQNSPIYAEIAKTIGKENEVILRDLYSISKRVAIAENKIVRTGASNQPLLNALNAEGLVGKLAAGAVKRGAVTGGTALAGGVAGGPVGAVVGGGIADALQQSATQAGKSNLDKLHGVLASDPFKELVEKVSVGAVKPADVNRAANDKAFRRFANTVLGIRTFDGRKNWLQGALTTGAASMATPEQQPATKIEVR